MLASEIRAFLIEKISRNGGHLASNLGVGGADDRAAPCAEFSGGQADLGRRASVLYP